MDNLKDELYRLDQRIRTDIEVFGWHVIKVEEDALGPSFGYSIGLFESFNHPEIIIVGPEVEAIHALVNKIGEAILEGVSFQDSGYYPSILQDAYLYFTSVAQKHYGAYLSYAQRYYKEKEFPVLQCLYPAPNGAYPGQVGWSEQLSQLQPFLGITPVKQEDKIITPQPGVTLPFPF